MQRDRFLRDEGERVAEADRSDKALAKEKRREKREKRKERERAETEGEGEAAGGDSKEDAMANFLKDAGGASGSEDEVPEPKRQKKWFEGKGKRRDEDEDDGGREIGTLEGLEAEAERLLG